MMRDKTVLTIILNYKTAAMTLRAAEAAFAEMTDLKGRILIVDNDSQDGSFEALLSGVKARGWPADKVEVLQSGRNGGFGAGNNCGIQHGFATGIDGVPPDYFYVLNSDAFPRSGAIKSLFKYMERNTKTGMAGSRICGEDGAPHMTAFRFPSIASEFEGAARLGPISRLFRHAVVPMPIPDKTRDVNWTAGASLMLRAEMLREIGLFDERFFLYFEETDLCLRAKRADWKVTYVHESEVMHIGSVSTGMRSWERIPQFWLDSRLHYFTENHGVGYALLATIAHLGGGFLCRLRCALQGKSTGEPKYFLIDMALHALKAVVRGSLRRTRKVNFPGRLAPRGGA